MPTSTVLRMPLPMKWWRKLYFFIFEVAIVNSFLLDKIHMDTLNQKTLSRLKYRKELREQLGNFRSKLKVKRPLVTNRKCQKN